LEDYGTSPDRHYLRYDDDKIAKRLAYDTTLLFASSRTSHTEDSTKTRCSRQGDNLAWCDVYRSVVNTLSQKGEIPLPFMWV